MNKELADWTIQYVKNRDLTFRKLVKFNEHANEDRIDFEFKDKTVTYLVVDQLSDKILDLTKKYEHKVIACLNNDDNFKFLIKHWKILSDVKNLSLLFINLKLHDKWVINPHTHSMIADPLTIESGLRTMYETANGKIAEVKVKKKKASMFEESSSSEEEDEGMDEK